MKFDSKRFKLVLFALIPVIVILALVVLIPLPWKLIMLIPYLAYIILCKKYVRFLAKKFNVTIRSDN